VICADKRGFFIFLFFLKLVVQTHNYLI